MDKLMCMRMFVSVADTGAFGKAAARASVSPAVVSRAIMDLEASLRTRLFNRTTRQVSLTEAGQRYLEHCTAILSHVERADAEAMGAATLPNGRLRVHATTSFGQHYMTPLLASYSKRFSDVSVELVQAQRMPHLLDERFDLSVVVAQGLSDSSFVAKQIGTARQVPCASQQYLSQHGSPETISDLDRHTIVQLVSPDLPVLPWIFDRPEPIAFQPQRVSSLTVNVPEALSEAIRAGMGIGLLPIPTALRAIRDGTLVPVLETEPMQPSKVYALYASRKYIDAKIKTLVEFLQEEVPLMTKAHEIELSEWIESHVTEIKEFRHIR